MFQLCRRILALIVVLSACVARSDAHVGSPDVYLEGNAGPYKLFITIRPPSVIPGVAELEVRSEGAGVKELRAVPLPISNVGAKFAPVPDRLAASKEDPQYFTGSLWMMAPGSWQVRIDVSGARQGHSLGPRAFRRFNYQTHAA